jgi:UDP-N-acetylmuramate dehydrogenase
MEIRQDEMLKDYTTIGIGGKIKWVFFPQSVDELILAVKYCGDNKINFFILAGGSNTVFADEDLIYDQAVICLSSLNGFEAGPDGLLECDPGIKLQDIVDYAQTNQLIGLTGLNRVPGTLGGAVVGNAGAFGTEIGDVVQKIDVVDLGQLHLGGGFKIHSLNSADCQFSYRNSVFKNHSNWLILKIWLQLKPVQDFTQESKKYQEIATKRDEIYPHDLRSPGSTFKNLITDNLTEGQLQKIPADWISFGNKLAAGKLLEEAGAKGFRVGQVHMRDTHANIMINDGQGTYREVKELIERLQQKVLNKFSINLEPEIRLIPGDFRLFKH